MSGTEIVLQARGVTRRYGETNVVDGLDLEVRRGEIYGFLGLNGAGKTTTIRMMLGLVKPTAGRIEVLGRAAGPDATRVFERVGSVVEAPGFYGNLTVRENLDLTRVLLGMRRDDCIAEAVELCKLERYVDQRASTLSLGTKQRLGLARALLHKPELLVLDEPTNGLDPVGIVDMRTLIKHLAEERDVTVFMSSHILAEVQQLATRIGIIHRGRLLEEIGFDELRRTSRVYLEFRVSDPQRAAWVFEELCGIQDYAVRHEGVVRVYRDLERAAELNRLLLENGIEVSEMHESEEDLEDHFVRITGGAADADASVA